MMTHTEVNPDSFLYQNVDVLNVPNLPSASRPNSAIYGNPSIEQSAVELVEELQKAIHSGNVQIAMELAKLLASMRLSFRASQEKNLEIRATDQEISVRIHICNKDLASTENHIVMKLRPTMTVETLKLVMYQKHGYLPELQKWIAGRRLVHDGETLAEYGVNFSGAVMFLYLITPTDSRVQGLRIHDAVSGPASVIDAAVLQLPQQHELIVTSTSVVPSFTTMTPSSFTPPISILPQTRVIQPQSIQAVPVLSSSPEKIGWSCPQCTYVNLPTRPGCEMCAYDRPVTYTTPIDYIATGHAVQTFPVSTEDSFDDVDAIIISDSSS